MAIEAVASDLFSGTHAARVVLLELAEPLEPTRDLHHEAQIDWADNQSNHQRRKSMTKRISAWWLCLLSAAFLVAVVESHHRSDSYREFAEFPGCPEIETRRSAISRFARRLSVRIQNRAAESSVPEIDAASAGHCYVSSRESWPIENDTPALPLRKEQKKNGDSHKDSNPITAYVPVFCPV